MVSPSKVQNYIPGEVDLDELSAKAEALLHQKPFEWQLTAANVILQGEDIIVDVGTGSGKTLVFSLPLLKDEHDLVMVVSPLTALMVEQVRVSTIIFDVHISNLVIRQSSQHYPQSQSVLRRTRELE